MLQAEQSILRLYPRQIISESLYWIAAIVLGITPAILATDFGGVLPWPKHVSALALTLACLTAAIARLISIGCPGEVRLPPNAFVATALLLALLIGGALQTVPLPQGFVAWLSPASYAAHVNWAGQIVHVDSETKIPISIAPFDSWHSVAYLAIATIVAFFAVLIFQRRERVTWLLSAIAVGACSIAIIGLARKLIPGFQLWSFLSGGEGAPFGTFLNRNNAALGINVGIGTALGLVVWRKLALSHADPAPPTTDRHAPPKHPSTSWRGDFATHAALASISICLVGLLGCGSRGGLLASVVAGAVTIFAVRRRTGRMIGVLATIATLVIIAFALMRTDTLGNKALRGDTLEQIGSTVESGSDRLSTDTRLAHWPDGFRTAIKHFPAGSGLATYGYAYLPWQQTSHWRWCIHADNLWLEMLVELGIWGVLLAATAVWLIVRSLHRLGLSADPLDQGLRVTGCYLSISIAVSQFFDFGLILPANLIATVIVFGVIMARASMVAVTTERAGAVKTKLVLRRHDDSWWTSPQFRREQLFQGLAIAGMFAIAIPAIHRLRLDSEADYIARIADQQLQLNQTNLEQLSAFVNQTSKLADRHPHPELLDALVKLQFQRGRLIELAIMNVGRMTNLQQAKLYSATSRVGRRLGWRSSEAKLSKSVTDAGQTVAPLPLPIQLRQNDSPYVDALRRSEASLKHRPLALTPRTDQIFLEFIHQSPQRTKTAITQSASLFRNNPELQLRFGSAAADQGDYDLAVKTWKRAATIKPAMVNRTLGRASRFPNFPVRDVIPASIEAAKKPNEFLGVFNTAKQQNSDRKATSQ